MRFLVTGGAGFIGSNLVEALLKEGHDVRIMDNFSTGRRGNIKEFEKDIEIVEGDIRSYHLVQKAVKNVEVILHQAALPSVPRSIADPITSSEVNINGILNVLHAAKEQGVRRLVFASSSSVYGDTPELPKHEGMKPNPLSPYAVQKLTGEHYLKVFNELYGLETIALRYFNVFGPKQDPNSFYSAVIPKFIKLMKEGKQPTIFGDGEQSRDFTYVANVVRGNILAATGQFQTPIVMNCATGGQVTLNELFSKIQEALGTAIEPIFSDTRKGDILHSNADISLIVKHIGFKPVVDFENGIKLVTDHFKNIETI